jgi:hypothetical protein
MRQCSTWIILCVALAAVPANATADSETGQLSITYGKYTVDNTEGMGPGIALAAGRGLSLRTSLLFGIGWSSFANGTNAAPGEELWCHVGTAHLLVQTTVLERARVGLGLGVAVSRIARRDDPSAIEIERETDALWDANVRVGVDVRCWDRTCVGLAAVAGLGFTSWYRGHTEVSLGVELRLRIGTR